MREQFDKKLADKIKSSFQGLEGEFDPSEWDKFSKKYFRKEANPMAIWIKWISGIAAAFLFGISIYTLIQPAKNPATDLQIVIADKGEEGSDGKPSEELSNTEEKPIPEKPLASNNPPEIQDAQNQKNPFQNSPLKTETSKSTLKSINQKQENVNIASSEVKKSNSLVVENNNGIELLVTIAEKSSTSSTSNIDPKEMTAKEAIAQIQEWKGEENIPSKETALEETNFKDPMKLGVLVAPQTISNSTQSINLGAGLMSELSFSRKLKLDVGMAYARQNISPTSGGNMLLAGVTNDMASGSLKAASITGNVINTSREVSFGQLEIPINLKYRVMDKKESGIYLISGLSNMVYLNQQDVTTYSTANLATVNFASSQSMLNTFSQTIEPDPQSNGIDTGRMLNFGIGFEQNLKNGTSLSIEPFYKLPLGDQTFTNQQFSIGGINLRMNFQLKSKKE
ncbi:outer membrane beta-barrel protein [Aquiflexum sp. TKW24L]|uniref:outer membrane beta-barrel protein n=1 Tax=Aquiflexum sp. TKW24L TaxID=2942212 RepID=UPI0020BF4800|nr:outer membrane beta-barrel protein [Aquiflexum sp. TKW24L]MCL6257770.1 outer membrane beta-barrel protein [Aquiflexum sp. TKW24L]